MLIIKIVMTKKTSPLVQSSGQRYCLFGTTLEMCIGAHGGVEHYDCLDTLSGIEIFFLPILPIALFSLITYRMKDDVFTTWIGFAKWWVPLTIFLTLIALGSDGSFFPVDKGRIAFVMTALFTALSFCIVVSVWARKGKK